MPDANRTSCRRMLDTRLLAFKALDIMRDPDYVRDALQQEVAALGLSGTMCWDILQPAEQALTFKTLPAVINVIESDGPDRRHSSSVQQTPAMPPPMTRYFIGKP